MDDILNAAESNVVAFLQADSDITDIANLIHEKLREDIRSYRKQDTPAVAVHATGFSVDEDDRHITRVLLFLEVVDAGGELNVIDGRVKQLIALILKKLRAESPYTGGNGIDEAYSDVYVSGGDVIPFQAARGWLISGGINTELTLRG